MITTIDLRNLSGDFTSKFYQLILFGSAEFFNLSKVFPLKKYISGDFLTQNEQISKVLQKNLNYLTYRILL